MAMLFMLIPVIAFMTYASPFVLILGFSVGIWARWSRRAPRLGMTMIVLCTLLFLTISGIVAWFVINPPGYSDPGISAFAPWILLCFLAGPQSLIAGILLMITTFVMIQSL